MLEKLKAEVCRANLDLVSEGLVIQTFGNVSGIDRARGLVVIKPSGVSYAGMKPRDMVVVSLADGAVVEGRYKPSSDTPTHLVLYRDLRNLGGIVHTHSLHATAWAQGCQEIPPLGTTHADYCHGPLPCTRPLRPQEIRHEYEANTGRVIIERFQGLDPLLFPGVLVACHGPFSWGDNPHEAVQHGAIIEYLARLASETKRVKPGVRPMPRALLDKHFFRKHGPQAYYGQGQKSGQT
jgi:L-ribulose-5-phosphate 4-epimerase